MTFDPASINFRLEKLLETIGKAKNSEKELLSIIKVLQELIKGINGNKAKKNEYLIKKKEEISAVLQATKQKIITQIENSDEPNKSLLLGKTLPHLNLTETEKKQIKHKVILEMKKNHLDFRLGVDFNRSETKNFQIINGQILIPFLAITGIGESYAQKIIARQQKGQITN
ncbi:12935_t:CDS:2 [Entrophospora sp. SA101]|nr:15223_t:CDS:2 [Entrophospora sp. SA101]CAJ0747031.1 12935_t:CDS:2 [Entrophospora sp. SA101]CAJ0897644.1 4223_t:CDS:2 [Entrophospora sp. SA101]